jgi:hypothetical protein
MSSNRTKMEMAELYRKLYLAIESLRKYILSGVDIEEQFTSKNSDERTIAALIADVKKVVNDVKEDVRQSVKKIANKAGANETNEHTQLIHIVRSLQNTVSDMHNDLSTLKRYRLSLSLSLSRINVQVCFHHAPPPRQNGSGRYWRRRSRRSI